MTGAGIWLLLAALAMPLRAGPADTGEIVFLAHLPGPFTFVEDGRLQGFAVDLVREMMDRAGHSRQLVIYPFKRALWTVQHRPACPVHCCQEAGAGKNHQVGGAVDFEQCLFLPAKGQPGPGEHS